MFINSYIRLTPYLSRLGFSLTPRRISLRLFPSDQFFRRIKNSTIFKVHTTSMDLIMQL